MKLVTNSEGPTWVVPSSWLPKLSSRLYETLTFASESVSEALSKKRPLANTGGAGSDPWPTEAVLEYCKNWYKSLTKQKSWYTYFEKSTTFTRSSERTTLVPICWLSKTGPSKNRVVISRSGSGAFQFPQRRSNIMKYHEIWWYVWMSWSTVKYYEIPFTAGVWDLMEYRQTL